jgi:DHA1 family tetracycline resistance protein-like MFS transporter
MSVYSLAQFLCAPLWGQWSDRSGRRPIMLVSIACTALSLAAFAASTTLWMLFVCRALHGAMTANVSTAQACMADLTSREDRAAGMGLVGAGFGLGFTIGPFVGGYFAQWGTAAPIWLAAGLSAINLVLAWRFLPETRHPSSAAQRPRVSFAALGDTLRRPGLGDLVGLAAVQVVAFAMLESTFSLFAEHEHGLTARTVGEMFGIAGLVGIVIQGGLVGRIRAAMGERSMATAGLAVLALGVAVLPLAPRGPALYAAFAVLAAGQSLATPALQALISRAAGADEQGQVLGCSQAMSALARVLGPAAAGVLFSRAGHAAPAWVAAVLLAGAALASVPATARAAAFSPK